jgi:hypothetical protein
MRNYYMYLFQKLFQNGSILGLVIRTCHSLVVLSIKPRQLETQGLPFSAHLVD